MLPLRMTHANLVQSLLKKIRFVHHPPGPRGRNCKPRTYRPPLRRIPETSMRPLLMTPQKPPFRCDVFAPPWTYSYWLYFDFSLYIFDPALQPSPTARLFVDQPCPM